MKDRSKLGRHRRVVRGARVAEQLSLLFRSSSFSKAELALLTPEDIYANAD